MPIIPQSSFYYFSLNASGLSGLFGGATSFAALTSVPIIKSRRKLGWFNQAGNYEVAKLLSKIPRARFWSTLYPGIFTNVEPAVLFGFDGKIGPRYISTQTGGTAVSKTGHIAYLFARECNRLPVRSPTTSTSDIGEVSCQCFVTIADLSRTDPLPSDSKTRIIPPRPCPLLFDILAIIPIRTSASGCALCVLLGDISTAALIASGMVCSGVSLLAVGEVDLVFEDHQHANPQEAGITVSSGSVGMSDSGHPSDTPVKLRRWKDTGDPDSGVSRGRGLLESSLYELVVLRGPEGTVNLITEGQFSLAWPSDPQYNRIGVCAALLNLHFLAQLLFIAQGLWSQLVFLLTLFISWLYSLYIASRVDKEKIQRDILCRDILNIRSSQMKKHCLESREAMATFALLLLAPAQRQTLKRVLDELIPNATERYRLWKDEVLRCIEADFHDGQEDFQFDFRVELQGSYLCKQAEEAAAKYEIYRVERSELQEDASRGYGTAYTPSDRPEVGKDVV